MKIGSSTTIQGLEGILNSFYYSTSYRVIDGKVYNNKGLFEAAEITSKKGRYYITIKSA